MGAHGCADHRNRQQTGIAGALRTCRNVLTKKRVKVSRLRVANSVMVVVVVVLIVYNSF